MASMIPTVALSVLLHGMTSYPGSEAYGNWYAQQDKEDLEEAKDVHHQLHPHVGRLTRRARAPAATSSATTTDVPGDGNRKDV